MTRAKVFGEDITIRLLSDDESTPLILDFDACEVASLRTNKMYKSIGKRISKPHSNTSGYKIILTRSKRDNYIEALTQYLDFFAEKGLDFPTFTVERIVNYQYASTELDTKAEFFKDITKQTPFQESALALAKEQEQRAEFIREATVRKNERKMRVVNSLASNYLPQLINGAREYNKDFNNFANSAQQALNPIAQFGNDAFKHIKNVTEYSKALATTLKDLDGDLGINPYDTPEYKQLLAQVRKHNQFETFQSKTLYKNCTIVEETFSDKPKEMTEERFVLYASNRINLSDDNEYEDIYLSDMFTQREKDKNITKGENILANSEAIVNSPLGDALRQLVKDAYRFENEVYFHPIYDSGKPFTSKGNKNG
jgi:hypothetical protein